MADPQDRDGLDELEYDPLDPNSATRVAPNSLVGTEVADLGTMPRAAAPAAAPPVDRQAATKVVSTPPARPAPPPLQIDFGEVLGKSKEAAGAHRIGAHVLEMGDFQSKYDKQAMERALAAPKFEMPATLQDDERLKPVRVVEKRGNVWIRAALAVLVPALLAVGGAFVYRHLQASGNSEELERLKKADEIHRKAALEHEKEMAR